MILREEEGHKNFGEECLEEMCQDPTLRGEIIAAAYICPRMPETSRGSAAILDRLEACS
jgi:hypothetical protein